jgi:hypothetical protein
MRTNAPYGGLPGAHNWPKTVILARPSLYGTIVLGRLLCDEAGPERRNPVRHDAPSGHSVTPAGALLVRLERAEDIEAVSR